MLKVRTCFLITAVIVAGFFRLLPHPPNMTPILGLALFAGATLKDKKIAIITPLLAVFASDAILGFYPHMEIVYLTLVLVALMGFLLGENASALRIGSSMLLGSLLFYVLTNAGVWAFDDLYPHTLSGLWTCYLMALPFLGNELAGDALAAVVLFGGLRMAERHVIGLGSATFVRQT